MTHRSESSSDPGNRGEPGATPGNPPEARPGMPSEASSGKPTEPSSGKPTELSSGMSTERGRPVRAAGWMRATFEAVRPIVVALLVLLVVRTVVVEAFKIPTSSMEGTLMAGDFLLVNKAVYGAEIPGLGFSLPSFAAPIRGDVVVFNPPHEPEKHYVKRLVGLPGDTLEMRDKRLLVNGTRLSEPYVSHQDRRGDAVHPGMAWQTRHLVETRRRGRYRPSRDNWGPLVVPEERYFVLGDNRDNSEDSRYWGFVHRDAMRGRPWIVYYSSDPDVLAGLGWFHEIRWERIGGRIQ